MTQSFTRPYHTAVYPHQRLSSYLTLRAPLSLPSSWPLPWTFTDVTPTCHATWWYRIPQKSPHGEAFEPFAVCRKFWPLRGRCWLKSHFPSLWASKEFNILCPGGHGTYFMLIGQVGVKMFNVYEDVFSFCFGSTSGVWGTYPIRLLDNFLFAYFP